MILHKVQSGSFTYGTNIETSDIDFKGIYFDDTISVKDHFFGLEKEVYSVSKDENYYSLRKLSKLIQQANPSVLEMLFTDNKFIIKTNHILSTIFENRDKFITTACLSTYAGYAKEQINKATQLNKAVNTKPEDRIRKHPIDFCIIRNSISDRTSCTLREFLSQNSLDEYSLSFSKIDRFGGIFELHNHKCKGLFSEDGNEPRVSEVPRESIPLGLVVFHQQAYSAHCKSFKSYQDWLKECNPERYITTPSGQVIDAKNMLHCKRMLDMAFEIAITGKVNVFRPNRDELLNIRFGKVDLVDLVKESNDRILELESLKNSSVLPPPIDPKIVDDMVWEIYEKMFKMLY